MQLKSRNITNIQTLNVDNITRETKLGNEWLPITIISKNSEQWIESIEQFNAIEMEISHWIPVNDIVNNFK